MVHFGCHRTWLNLRVASIFFTNLHYGEAYIDVFDNNRCDVSCKAGVWMKSTSRMSASSRSDQTAKRMAGADFSDISYSEKKFKKLSLAK